ncbi:MAG: GNAT family N-acetyltransferase [Eubacterium sp.]|nr:GNAT family N-acetyltransferase [Eubacterium sp.]
MKLRNIADQDADLLLEWMHEKESAPFFEDNGRRWSSEDVALFIKNCEDTAAALYRTIAADTDECMGIAGLQNIDRNRNSAELVLSVREAAMRKGYAWFALVEMLDMAFKQLNLESVYWHIHNDDDRSRRFYDKHGFHQMVDVPEEISAFPDNKNLRWYSVLSSDDYGNRLKKRDKVAGCKVIRIKTITTLDAGELSFFEGTHDIDFEIKRIYFISKVPEGVRRGFHAHKQLKQLLFCPYGKIQLVLENRNGREEITLEDPSVGVVIDQPTWREMLWMEKDSVLCVAASDYYSEDDYIRDYEEFKKYVDDLKI